MTIVPFEPEFLPGVLRLCAAESWPTYPEDPDRALRTFLAAGTLTLVALSEQEEVIGFAHALADETRIYLSELTVDAAHRRRGVGRRLVEGLFDRSPAARMDVLSEGADRFYESFPHRRLAGFRLYADGARTGRAR